MKEKDFTPAILQAMRDDSRFGSGFIEIKVARGRTMGARQLADHQRRSLELCEHGAVYFKIPDCGYQNPCDAVLLKRAEGWLVIVFDIQKPKMREVWALRIGDIGRGAVDLDTARIIGKRIYIKL